MSTSPSSHAAPGSASAAVDVRGVTVAGDAILDVLFDGRRVWSVDPSLAAGDGGAATLVPWPPALLPYLDGVTQVQVRHHITHEVLVDQELEFGSARDRVRVVDSAGQPLVLDKWGDLVQPFDSVDESAIRATVDRAAEILQVLREDCGVPAFVTYGTLLGAVRDGRLIGHDNDIDVAYLSDHDHPADVARESFRIQHTLARRGWKAQRISGGFLQVTFEDQGSIHFDVFACFHVDGRFYQVFAVEADLPRSAIVPLDEVSLHGRRLPAPADPEALLAATYGPTWRVPDPSFDFSPDEETKRKIGGRGGWLGGYHARRRYWREFYSSGRSAAVPDEPSAFARWANERETSSAPVVDIGCGTGRDAFWFARSGHRVLGLDYVPAVLDAAQARAEAKGLDARFEYFDLYDLRQVLATGGRLAHDDDRYLVYGRFLLHALEDAGRHNLWRLASTALRSGGRLYLEFRTGEDANEPHVFGEHFRRYMSGDDVVAEVESYGGSIEHREEGRGLAVYKEEDPHVCRLVARWE